LTNILLIRHGRSTWNAEHRIQGWADPPLDETGREQARQLAKRLTVNPPIILYTSPQIRALETATIIRDALNIPIVPDERLKEHGAGDLTGLTQDQVKERFPGLRQNWLQDPRNTHIPNGESYDTLATRVIEAFKDIVSRHRHELVGVVTHGGTLSVYLCHLIGTDGKRAPFRFGNCSLSIIEVNPIRPRISLLNDTCHLQEPT
jgi:broad specificity phosphatase PhoE